MSPLKLIRSHLTIRSKASSILASLAMKPLIQKSPSPKLPKRIQIFLSYKIQKGWGMFILKMVKYPYPKTANIRNLNKVGKIIQNKNLNKKRNRLLRPIALNQNFHKQFMITKSLNSLARELLVKFFLLNPKESNMLSKLLT